MKDRVDQLVRLIKYYDYEFHIKGNQLISEYERDSLREELMKLEQQYPEYVRPDSPTLTIGVVEENRECISHPVPMLSLQHSYERESIHNWIKKLPISHSKSYRIPTEPAGDFIVEPKFDGVAVELRYIDGVFESLSLRGNGYEGEDISSFAPYISNIPMSIPEQTSIYIRGEICLPKGTTKENKRNIVAGLLRKKVPEPTEAEFIPYSVIIGQGIYLTPYKSTDLEWLSKFMNVEPYIVCSEAVIDVAESISVDKYETDGVVIKLNHNVYLGHTAKYTKDAIAYKFNNKFYSCNVNHIDWNINRSGQLIPTICINSVNIGGCYVNKLTGHNKKFLKTNHIGIDSLLEIERVGNSVPQVKHVLKGSQVLNIYETCKHCHTTIEEEEIHYVCNNEACPGRIYKRLLYFFQKFDVKGLSHNILERVEIKRSYLDTLEYAIKWLLEGSWVVNKNDQKALEKLNVSLRHTGWNRFIEALGIPGVGNINLVKGIIAERLNSYIDTHKPQLNRIYNLFHVHSK